MAGIPTGIAACFLSSSMANCIIPVPPMDSNKNGVQQPTVSQGIKNGAFVLTRGAL